MTIARWLPRLGVALSAGFFVHAASPNARANKKVDDLIKKHRHPLTVRNGRIEGPGAERLVTQAKSAHYVMFGEQHATADIARLATALFKALAPVGFQTAVLEVGPWSTPRLEALLRQPSGALRQYLAQDGRHLTFPFYFFAEEAEFAKAVVAAANPRHSALWGVDQEFFAAAPVLVDLFAHWADSAKANAAVAELMAQVRSNPMLLGTGTDADWLPVFEAFKRSKNANARDLVAEIMLSREIYGPFVGRGGSIYLANEKRERYMKRAFERHLDRINHAQAGEPRLFFKFGAGHVAYGHSPTHVVSFGTYVRERGLMFGKETFNVIADCIGGRARDPRKGTTVPCKSYYLKRGSTLRKYVSSKRPTFIDLKALRPHARQWRTFDERSRNLIWAYDAYVALPNPKPATLLAPGKSPAGRRR